jgi:hypothetical protein
MVHCPSMEPSEEPELTILTRPECLERLNWPHRCKYRCSSGDPSGSISGYLRSPSCFAPYLARNSMLQPSVRSSLFRRMPASCVMGPTGACFSKESLRK